MKRLSLLAVAAALLSPAAMFADSHETPPPLSDVWFVMPKPGMAEAFEKAVAAHMAYRAEKQDSRTYWTFTPVVGHQLGVYQFRACCFDWADEDAYLVESAEKGFDEHWNDNVDQHVAHYHHYFERSDWAHSYWPENGTAGPYYAVTSWTQKQGAGRAPREAQKKMSRLALDNGWTEKGNPWMWLSRIGGKSKLMIVTPYADYASMAPPEQGFAEFIAEQLDSEDEAAEMFQAFGSGFESSDFTVWYYRDELSMPSREQKTD